MNYPEINNNDAKHSDIRFSNMEEIFAELASSQRLSIIFMISCQRLKLSTLAKSLNLTMQEVHRNTNRLLDSGLIEKNSEGVFFLTTFGNAIIKQLSIFDFLASNKCYFSDHINRQYTDEIYPAHWGIKWRQAYFRDCTHNRIMEKTL